MRTCFILILLVIKMSNLILDLDFFSLKTKKINTLFISNLMGKDIYFVRYTHMNTVLHEIIIRKISTFLEKKKNKHLI